MTIVFWTLLADNAFGTTYSSEIFLSPFLFRPHLKLFPCRIGWSNISQHTLNSPFALFEILFTNAGPQPWSHIPFLVILLGLYLGVAYITYDTQHLYVYSFLDPKSEGGLLAAYIVGIAVGAVVVFSIAKGLQHLRVWLLRGRAWRNDSRDNAVRTPEPLDEWETVEMDPERPTKKIVLKTSREAGLGSIAEAGDISMESATSERGSREKSPQRRTPLSARHAV